MFKIIAITGYSNSGKTSLISKLIKKFSKEGFKIGVVKTSKSSINLDEKGKDTFIYSKSGCETSIFLNDSGCAVFINKRTKFRDMVPLLSSMHYVIVEGNLNEPIVKLRLDERYAEDSLSIDIKGKSVDEVYEIIKSKATILLPNRPDCGYCGEDDCFKMMEKVIQGKRKTEDCVVLKENILSIRIDGEKMSLPPFIKKMIKDVNVGMLKNLKLPKNFKEVTISINGDSIRDTL